MPPHFSAIPGAQGFQQSNPSALATAALLGSAQLFQKAGGMLPLRERSLKLTGYLEQLLQQSRWWLPPSRVGQIQLQEDRGEAHDEFGFTIITPPDPASRGSQLSLVFVPLGGKTMPTVSKLLEQRGVVGDSRKPDVIRLAPAALYNSFDDVEKAAAVLEDVLTELRDKTH
jgi:kynureninase